MRAPRVLLASLASGLVLAVVACGTPEPSRLPTPSVPATTPAVSPDASRAPSPTPEPPRPSWFGQARVVVGSTGEFTDPAERTLELPAWLVVWRDGVVSAVVYPLTEPPELGFIELTDVELQAVESTIRSDDLIGYVHDRSRGHVSCADCNPVVIQLDVDGRFVEVITPLIGESSLMGYPPGVAALDDLVSGLWNRTHAGPIEPWTGTMPTVLAAPLLIGG